MQCRRYCAPYSPSGRNALCVARDAHRYSAVVVESYVPYSPSGRNALCVVRDAHRCCAVVVESYVPYSPSGRNTLCVVRDAHRYSAVVVESYVPYSPSGRNALCAVRDAHRCCVVVVVTQLTFVPKQKNATDAAAAPNSGDASTKTPEACATLKSRLVTYRGCPKTRSQLDEATGPFFLTSSPTKKSFSCATLSQCSRTGLSHGHGCTRSSGGLVSCAAPQ